MGESVEQLLEKVKALLEKEDETSTQFKTGIAQLLPEPEVKVESGEHEASRATEISSALSRIKLGQVTKLRKFEKGENFSRFCERFQEYVQITQINDSQLHLFFLQHVDDETYSTLKSVNLGDDEKRNCSLFCEIYKEAVYGTDSVPLKNEVLECKQAAGESITSFSHRLREKATIAFTSEDSIDENCLLALMRGVKDNEVRRKLNESSVTTFSEALKLAKKLEKISNMFEGEVSTASILKGSKVFFIDNESQKKQGEPVPVSPSQWNRPRHGSDDSRGSNRSSSPWRSSRDRWPRTSNYRPRERGTSLERARSPSVTRGQRRDTMVEGRQSNSFRSEMRRCWACNRKGHLKRNCYAKSSITNTSSSGHRDRLN